jgi:predicted  nucleic acid-binding Zn-ribbon protein
MSGEKEAIIEYAKELFLTPDEQGNHKYSLREIATQVQQKFNRSINASTILRWAEKYGWDKLWDEGVREGITELIAKQESDKSKEEQFKEAIAKAKRNDFIIASNLKTLGYQYIKEHGFDSVMEALRAIETGMRYTQNFQELETDQTIVVRIRRNGD